MISYILERILYGLTILVGVVSLVFILFNMKPGDPARMLGGQYADEVTLANINRDLGLDKSLFARYALFMNDLSPLSWHQTRDINESNYLDPAKYNYIKLIPLSESAVVLKNPYLRRSYQSKREVSTILAEAIPGTAVIALVAIIFAFVVGVGLGVIAALKKNKFTDQFILFVSVIGMSGPSFFVAIIFAWLGGFLLADFTGLNMTGSLFDIDPFEGRIFTPANMILPAIVLGIRPLAVVVQLTRSSLLEVMELDYIRTARAKGLNQRQVIVRHALKNALNPVITAVSGWFASLLAGAVFVEFVFGWKGLGLEVFQALEKDDLPVVTGAVLFFAATFVVMNVLVDLIYGWLDPRVRIR